MSTEKKSFRGRFDTTEKKYIEITERKNKLVALFIVEYTPPPTQDDSKPFKVSWREEDV
ncbi:MAG: hypothetical protein JRI72_06730 [Deltaproteobacteria bacterium]|nr:hypothetical protein [Deltaproteobacteria bacterium]